MLASAPAFAQETVTPETHPSEVKQEAKVEAPTIAYTYTAYGSTKGVVGAQAYGQGLAGKGQDAMIGGGVLVWGAPVERLTLVVDAPRDVYREGHFAPAAAGIFRFLGNGTDGPSLGGMLKYKVEGFGTDPNGDTESEVEGGILFSYAASGFHLDVNAITGFGLTDEGEVDTEGRFRIGYDVASLVRIGIDAQGRDRLHGTNPLPNGSKWDMAGGAQIIVGSGQYFGALTAGPATMGLTTHNVVGETAVLSLCAML